MNRGRPGLTACGCSDRDVTFLDALDLAVFVNSGNGWIAAGPGDSLVCCILRKNSCGQLHSLSFFDSTLRRRDCHACYLDRVACFN